MKCQIANTVTKEMIFSITYKEFLIKRKKTSSIITQISFSSYMRKMLDDDVEKSMNKSVD